MRTTKMYLHEFKLLVLVLLALTAPAWGQAPADKSTPEKAAPRTPPTEEQLRALLKRAPEADTNRDGVLSRDEARAYFQQRRNQQDEKQAPGKQAPGKQTQNRGPSAPEPTVANAAYGPHERNVLDFWQAKSDTPTPLVVYIHGGGFVAGDKSSVAGRMVTGCLESGISFAAINYRYSTTQPFPGPMHDSARAIQYLRSRAKEWNLDPQRVAAYGGSAGAGISMWLGFHPDLANPNSTDPVERESTRLTCLGSTGGQCTYDPLKIKAWIGGRAWEHPALVSFYGMKSLEEVDDPKWQPIYDEAGAITHLTADDPPVFMSYSEEDAPLPEDSKPGAGIHHPKFGHILKEKMDSLGIEAVYRHNSDGKSPNPQDDMLAFFKRHLLLPEKAKP